MRPLSEYRRLALFRRLSRRTALLIAGIVLALLGASAFGVSKLEEKDRFCATCHLVAERTYYNRAQFTLDHPELTVPDLASYHYLVAQNNPQIESFRCVDCHRGRQRVLDRATTLGVGFYDTLLYLTGSGSPTEIEQRSIHRTAGLIEDSCINCHSQVLVTLGFNNHYHNYLPAAVKAYDLTGNLSVEPGMSFELERELLLAGVQAKKTDVTCADCHLAHVLVIGGARVEFIQEDVRNRACTQCHHDSNQRIDLIPGE